jgi:hypothetical protein
MSNKLTIECGSFIFSSMLLSWNKHATKQSYHQGRTTNTFGPRALLNKGNGMAE